MRAITRYSEKRRETCEKPLVYDKCVTKKCLLLLKKWSKIYLKVEKSGGKWNEVVGKAAEIICVV